MAIHQQKNKMDFSHTVGFPIVPKENQQQTDWCETNLTADEKSCVFGQAEKLRNLYRSKTKQMVYIFTPHPALPQSKTHLHKTTLYTNSWDDMQLEEFNEIAKHIPITVVSTEAFPERTYDIACKNFKLDKTEINFYVTTDWYLGAMRRVVLKETPDTINYDCNKLFITMNKRASTYRMLMMNELSKNRMLEKAHWSWVGQQVERLAIEPIFDIHQKKQLGDLEKSTPAGFSSGAYSLPEEYFDSYIEVCVESFYDPDAVHLTEKTIRPYLSCKPSLCLNAYGHHEYLESIGIKLYTELFDYDIIEQPNLNKRINGIVQNLKALSELSKYDLNKKIKSIEDKIRHNKETLLQLPETRMPTPELQYLVDKKIFPVDMVLLAS
tara:strand:+ start:341 stop:1483 length:1143 start_codon:yes stop_codon:yes gene_type:complete